MVGHNDLPRKEYKWQFTLSIFPSVFIERASFDEGMESECREVTLSLYFLFWQLWLVVSHYPNRE